MIPQGTEHRHPFNWSEMPARLVARCLSLATGVNGRIRGKLRGDGICAFWWCGLSNFGDLLTPLLLTGYNLTPILTAPANARVVAVGSILHLVPENFSGIILGSGMLYENMRRSFPKARIWAVRGVLTRQRIGAPPATRLGDPGLLIGRLRPWPKEKRYQLGIVPHYSNRRDPSLGLLLHRYPREITIIDVRRKALRVIEEIASCATILSSSLHGLVVADALNIPNGWIHLADTLPGGTFKFHDYYSALKVERLPTQLAGDERLSQLLALGQLPYQEVICQLQDDLQDLFRRLSTDCQFYPG